MIDPTYVDTGLDKTFNNIIVAELQTIENWQLSPDQYEYDYNELMDYSDTGLLLLSYSIERDSKKNQEFRRLNAYGDLIGRIIMQKQNVLNVKKLEIIRILWNYYNKGSTGVTHRDINLNRDGEYLSAVYYLNDCDGGTIVEGVKYNCKPGHALIFDSKNQHKGFGPFKFKNKFCVNFIYRV